MVPLQAWPFRVPRWQGSPVADSCSPTCLILIDEDPQRRSVKVVKLSGTHGPEERRKPRKAKRKRNGDQDENAVHRATRFRRRALATTSSDDPDMAAAATSGVTRPVIAKGTASAL